MQNVTNHGHKIWPLVFNREAGGIVFFVNHYPSLPCPPGKTRLQVVPHFPPGIVERAKRERV